LFFQTYDFFFLIFSYFVGSIPFGLVISKLIKLSDPRFHGSKNIGATNITRLAGYKFGFLTLSLDIFKAVGTIKFAQFFYPDLVIWVSFWIFIGHIYPIWLKFRGGKGVAVFLGILASFSVELTVAFIITWILIFFIFRYSSLSALLACVSTFLVSYFSYNIQSMMYPQGLDIDQTTWVPILVPKVQTVNHWIEVLYLQLDIH